jgi:anaerobic ribonucleoside-triphosphate reductase activating protein
MSKQEPRLRVARIVKATRTEGPGLRSAVWFAGCSIRCDGCFNPHLWHGGAGRSVDVSKLVESLCECEQIEGITLLGGEPFDQAQAAAQLALQIRMRELTVTTFTGFTFEELNASGDPHVRDLLAQTDLLIDGPFLRDQLDGGRPWVGSTNQRYWALTEVYADMAFLATQDALEVRVKADGSVLVNGWADTATLEALFADGFSRVRPRKT